MNLTILIILIISSNTNKCLHNLSLRIGFRSIIKNNISHNTRNNNPNSYSLFKLYLKIGRFNQCLSNTKHNHHPNKIKLILIHFEINKMRILILIKNYKSRNCNNSNNKLCLSNLKLNNHNNCLHSKRINKIMKMAILICIGILKLAK